jgi:short-chain fatty acids transporter
VEISRAMNTTSWMQRAALGCCNWAERWIPDAYVFVASAVAVVAVLAMLFGASPTAAATAFGEGFWSLIPFTMQMSFVLIGGYVVASSPPMQRCIDHVAAVPRSGPGAVAWIAAVSTLLSLLHWGLSSILGSLLVLALARRTELKMDYRAAAAAAYLGLGSVWALGLSSSAAQLQANPASMPPALLAISGVLPFSETLFLWQSLLMIVVLVAVTVLIAWWTAPRGAAARLATEEELSGAVQAPAQVAAAASRPGEWLEYSPVLNIAIVVLGGSWLVSEFARKGALGAIANLNTYNFLFLMLGLLLSWRPRTFLDSVARAAPAVSGVLIQFPFYGGIAALLTLPAGDAPSLANRLAEFFTQTASREVFPLLVGTYSAVLGFFIPSGGGKWIIEAPYVMQAANELRVHLGWTVQIYNAAEALPNLINPFWMLPLLGILRLKAREVIGFTIPQFFAHVPLVLLLLWVLGLTLEYEPPVMPP